MRAVSGDRALIAFIFVIALFSANAYSYNDPRCCVEHERLGDGSIKRSSKVLRQFRTLYPCPTGADLYDPCPGWQIDHVIPLGVGGKDEIFNLQWLPVEIKTCSGDLCKDRWEREVYKK